LVNFLVCHKKHQGKRADRIGVLEIIKLKQKRKSKEHFNYYISIFPINRVGIVKERT
jgi:hypothetical protein